MQELARRCDTLIRLVEKENEEVEAAEQAEKKKSSKKTSGSRATDSSGGAAGTSTKVRTCAELLLLLLRLGKSNLGNDTLLSLQSSCKQCFGTLGLCKCVDLRHVLVCCKGMSSLT